MATSLNYMMNPGHIRQQLKNHKISFNEESVVNLSKRHVPLHVKVVASLGRTFNHRTPLDFPAAVGSIISMIDILQSCDNFSDFFHARHEFNILKRSIFNRSVNDDRPCAAQSYIALLARLTVKFLQEPKNKDIIIVQADKGGKSVIMDREEYDEKAVEHIEQNLALGNYAIINNLSIYDVQNEVESRYRRLISEINPFLIMDKAIREPLKSESFLLPLFYGAPKIHKPRIPLRPIISSCNMIGDRLSSWLLVKLGIIAEHFNKFKVKSVLPVVMELKRFQLEQDHVLCSLDYESMYTNIDVDETTRIIIEFYHLIAATTCVPCEVFIRCVRFFINDAAYFGALGRIFKQMKGLAMGNQLAQVMAEIRTDYALINTLRDIDASLISFLYKYVDDIFSSIHKDHVQRICNLISTASGMNITVEPENGMLEVVFLDCTFKRNPDHTISNKWYMKECSSMRTLNYHSHHVWHVKRNCATNLVRSAKLRTSQEFMAQTHDKLYEVLSNSSYPNKFIQKLLEENYESVEMNQAAFKKTRATRYFSFPMFEPIANRVESITRALDLPITLSRRPFGKNRSLVFANMKDRIPVDMKKNCLFQTKCENCDFSHLLSSTTVDVRRTIERSADDVTSALRLHSDNHADHKIREPVQIIYSFRNASESSRSLEYVGDINKLTKSWNCS